MRVDEFFQFYQNEDDYTSCCCFRKPIKHPKEYAVDRHYRLRPRNKSSESVRAFSNARLEDYIIRKLEQEEGNNFSKFIKKFDEKITFFGRDTTPVTWHKLHLIVTVIDNIRAKTSLEECCIDQDFPA
jgi:hypothetical protein